MNYWCLYWFDWKYICGYKITNNINMWSETPKTAFWDYIIFPSRRFLIRSTNSQTSFMGSEADQKPLTWEYGIRWLTDFHSLSIRNGKTRSWRGTPLIITDWRWWGSRAGKSGCRISSSTTGVCPGTTKLSPAPSIQLMERRVWRT